MPTDGRWAFTRQPLLSTRDGLGNGTLGHTQPTSACLPASSPRPRPFQQRRLILERTPSPTNLASLCSALECALCQRTKDSFCSLKYSLEVREQQPTWGLCVELHMASPGSAMLMGARPPQRVRPPFQPREPLQRQSLALPALFLTSALLSLVPIDKNVFFVSSVIPGLFSVGT